MLLRVMREAPIPGRYGLIDLLVCMMYDICYISTPTLTYQFGRAVQHGQRAGATVAIRIARGAGESRDVIELVKRAVGRASCRTCGDKR